MRTQTAGRNRIWELDFLRGIAIILMVYFHVMYDLSDIYGYDISITSGINYYIGKAAAVLFMFISGISCHFSKSNVKRGVRLFGIAMVLTLVTHLISPQFGIKFGILHFLGISMVLFPLFNRLNSAVLLLLAVVILFGGNMLYNINTQIEYLFMFNIVSNNFTSSDFYPLFPWIGITLTGIAAGKIFYKEKSSIFKFALKNNIISFAGTKSILIYLVHQPLILGILALAHSI